MSSDQSARLALPYLAAAQAQKHVTHNAAVRALDALVQLVLQSVTQTSLPGAPSDGQCWYVPAGATGLWSGKAGSIATYDTGAWDYLPCRAGFLAYVADQGALLMFGGSAWAAPSASGGMLAGSLHGAGIQARVLEEDCFLSGSSVDTSMVIPDRAIVLGVTSRTLIAITGATSYDVGIAAERAKFGGTLGIAAGSTNGGVIGPTAFYAPTALRISANGGAFTGGSVRLALHLLLCPGPSA
ncbi:DUF2793 domain-containing protein [Roseixanthobacter glucoisosaccharinicivorans]|uniref:DUF2793 domain-containing protein n=1 Tax=Roseixanthobacter glucoisosaccharinicivorans TaxID=3119923 RepID=UPI0037265C6E